MNGLLKKAGLGIALAAAAVTAAAPADAQRYGYRHYGGHYGRGGDVAAGALLGGIVGLGVGAAIANDHRGYDGYYNRGYAYDPYYAQPYYRDYYRPRCFTEFRWDPYYGGRVPVRVCR